MEILRKLAQLAGTDRTAIVYGDGTLSYRTLDHWSDAFAAYLKREAPDGKAPVLIYGHKELEIPACMFGSLKAGRGYVPVDVTYPPERVAQIAAEAKPCVIVDLTGTLELPGLNLSQLREILRRVCAPALEDDWLKPDETAYILFTSGSTGKPKGVQITAKNLAAFHAGVRPFFDGMQPGGAFLNEISYSFDVSVCALYEALGRGMTLWTADRTALENPKLLFDILKRANLTDWVSTPSLAELCVQSDRFCGALMPQLRQMLFCGEVLTKKLTQELMARFPGVPIVNAYGPTETTVLVTGAQMTKHAASGCTASHRLCVFQLRGAHLRRGRKSAPGRRSGRALPARRNGQPRVSGKTGPQRARVF